VTFDYHGRLSLSPTLQRQRQEGAQEIRAARHRPEVQKPPSRELASVLPATPCGTGLLE
jgi:hypothetical protein